MLDKFMDIGVFLLSPRSRLDFVWKLLVLCSLTTAVAILTETVMGTEVSNPIETYFLIVFIVSAPFFTIAMSMTARMVSMQEELERLASSDLLTGLSNRRAFFNGVEEMGDGQLILLDIDHFKAVNDSFGHATGDAVLVAMARHLKEESRSGDMVARIGGEEFVVYLPGADTETARLVAARLVAGVKVETDCAVNLTVTLSAGVTEFHAPLRVSDAIQHADEALYRAKRAGRARYTLWSAPRAA